MHPFYYELELIVVGTQTLIDTPIAELPDDLQRFFRRAQGTTWVADEEDGTGKWTMGRAHFNVKDQVLKYPSRAEFERDPDNPVTAWLKDLFAKYWQPPLNDGLGLRVAAAFWCDDGMQYGTTLLGMVGPDVDTSQHPPVFPYDKRIRNWMPDLHIRDQNGDIIQTRNIPWDVPVFTFTDQFHATLSTTPEAKRRWFQETTNDWLDATAWGVPPWKPSPSANAPAPKLDELDGNGPEQDD